MGCNTLEKLDLSEQEVVESLNLANETLEELIKLPNCDSKKLQYLSERYINLIQNIRETLKSQSHLIRPYTFSEGGNYSAKKRLELNKVKNDIMKDSQSQN